MVSSGVLDEMDTFNDCTGPTHDRLDKYELIKYMPFKFGQVT